MMGFCWPRSTATSPPSAATPAPTAIHADEVPELNHVTASTTAKHDGLSEEAQEEGWRKPLAVPMSDLADVLPYVSFIQAKFFDVDENLVDGQIPWREILQTLKDNEWSGYLSSEYEGDRLPYRSIEQVRRQHALLHRLEAEIAGTP
jgi:hypothetical protein